MLVREDMAAWPRIRLAQWAVANADPDVESPLESAGRLALLRAGLPPGRSNVWIGDSYPRYRLDHYWLEFRLGAEGDGLDKYQLTDPVEAVRAEKEREWQLQEWGIGSFAIPGLPHWWRPTPWPTGAPS